MGVGKRLQMMLEKEGGVQKGVRGPRVNQSKDGDGRLTGDQELNKKNKVTRGGVREGGWGGKSAAQPGPYSLGGSFFGMGKEG